MFVVIVWRQSVIGQTTPPGPPDPLEKGPLVIQSAPIADIPRLLTNERPVKRELFEEFLKRRHVEPDGKLIAPSSIQVTSAHYDARFATDGQLHGTGRIVIRSMANQPVALPTPEFSLSVSELRWKDRDDPVLWGIAPDRRLVLIVPSSGELEFDWTAKADKQGRGRFVFDLGLMQSLGAEVVISAPRNWSAEERGDTPSSVNADDANGIRHRFQLGSSAKAQIVVENSLAPDIANPRHWVRMSNRYEVGRQGMDVIAELEVETSGSPLSRLPLRVDESLQLVSARMGDQRLAWSVDEDSPERSIELQFDPPLTESGRKIRIEARAAFDADQLASLPQLRPAGNTLREAEVLLNVAPPLELVAIELQGARFADTGSVLLPRGGESRRVVLQSPEADIRCAFRMPSLQGKVRYFADVKLSESSWELDASLRMTIESGERFELSTSVPAGWIIDNVESIPVGMVENWGVTTEPAQQKLSLRLQRSLSSKAPLGLRISAHMPRVGSASISSKQFWVANFEGIALDAGFLHLQAGTGIQLNAATEAPRLRAAELETNDLEAFGSKPTGTIYRLSPQSEFLITQNAVDAEFRVTSVSRVLVEDERVVGQHRIIVTPQRQQLTRLLLRIAPATGDEVHFELEESPSRSVIVKQVGSDPQGDLWELRFSEPMGAEFTVSAMESASLGERPRLRTLRCEGASTQESTLRVFSSSERTWDISPQGAEPILRQQNTSAPWVEIASLRYGLNDNPEVSLTRKEVSEGSTPIWAWEEARASYVGGESHAIHASQFRFDCPSSIAATFQIPSESRLLEVRIDRRPITSFQLSNSTLHVVIPAARSPRLVEIRVAAPQDPVEFGIARLRWGGATPLFPSLAQSWTIWTPQDLAVTPLETHFNWRGVFSLWEPDAFNRMQEMASSHAPNLSLRLAEDASPSALGWASTKLSGISNPDLRLLYYSAPSWRSAGWCVMVISLLVGYSLLGGSTPLRTWVLILGALFSLTGCFAPAPFDLLLSGLFLGVLLALLLRSISSIRIPRGSGLPAAQAPIRASLMILLSFWVWNGVTETKSAGQEAGQEAASTRKMVSTKPVRNVLDPVDDEGKPTGDFVYVSPELFEEIALAGPTQAIDASLMKEVRYRISRSTQPPTESLILGVEYVYLAHADSQMAPLLIDSPFMSIGQQEVFVDGERRTLPKLSESRPHQLELLGRGLHTIRMELKLPLKLEGDLAIGAWQTSPLPKQQLEIETDSSLDWQLDGVEIRHDPISRTAKIPLPPSREVKLGVRRVNPIPAVSEMALRHDAWISVNSGSVSMESLVRVGAESSARSIEFELDEGVSLGSVVGDNRRTMVPIAIGDRRYRIPLESPADEEAEIRILCSRKTGLGLSRLASSGIQFPGAKVAESRIGISAASEFQLQTEIRAGVSDLPVAQFLQGWPQGRTPPRLALSVEPGKSWSVDLVAAVSQSAVSVQTEYFVRATDLQIQWDASVATSSEPVSLYFLQVPAALQVESITVLEASVNRLVRFARTSPERVSLLMRTASTEPRQIRLRGAMPISLAEPVSLPVLRLENAATSSSLLRMFREDDTRVEMAQTQGLRMLDPAARAQGIVSVIQPDRSRLVGEWELLSPSQAIEAQITSATNSPRMTHESTARFETRDSKWKIEQSIKLAIASGTVDELVFELPKGLREPLEIAPSMPFRVVRKEDESAQLIVRPEQAWKDSHELRIAGDYLPEFGEPELTLASIRLLKSSLQSGWIAAPKQSGSGVFQWKGAGSDGIAPPPGQSKSADEQWFQQRDDAATVRLQRSTSSSKAASARLVGDIALQGTRFTGVFTWIWGSAPGPKVELIAPKGLEVLRVTVLGASARVTQLSNRRWQLSTAPGSAPPALEVVCRGDFDFAAPLVMPLLEGAPTQEALLTLHASREWKAASPSREKALSIADGFHARLRLLDQSKRDAQTVLPTLGEQESTNWRRCWLAHWDAARAIPPQAKGVAGLEAAGAPKWLQEADADRSRFVGELSNRPSESEIAERSGVDSIAANLADDLFAEQSQIIYFYEEGKPPTIHLARRSSAALAWDSIRSQLASNPWILPGGGVGLLLVMLFMSSTSGRFLIVSIAPLMAWIVLGIAWWLWFAPFWFGPLLSVLATLGFLFSVGKRWSRKGLGGTSF